MTLTYFIAKSAEVAHPRSQVSVYRTIGPLVNNTLAEMFSLLPLFESCIQMHPLRTRHVNFLDWRSVIKYNSIINLYHFPLMLDFLC